MVRPSSIAKRASGGIARGNNQTEPALQPYLGIKIGGPLNEIAARENTAPREPEIGWKGSGKRGNSQGVSGIGRIGAGKVFLQVGHSIAVSIRVGIDSERAEEGAFPGVRQAVGV